MMSNNDLTFFTNEPERNLYDRFSKILNKNTQFFDVLVGYFRASGFYLMQEASVNEYCTNLISECDNLLLEADIVKISESETRNIMELWEKYKEKRNEYGRNI